MTDNGYDIGRGIGEAIIGPKLTAAEKYNDFLNETKYFNEPFDKRLIKEQTYYIQMSEQDRKENLMFVELVNVARAKKAPNPSAPPNLDTLGNAGFEGLALDETVKLYNKPGVRIALETIIANFDNDSPLGFRSNSETYSLRTAANKHEVDVCRKAVSDTIRSRVKIECQTKRGEVIDTSDTEGKDKLELRTREAEQIAFTLAYIGGAFDSTDSVWSNMGRVRAPKCMNDYLVNVPMKLAANPMDWLVSTFKKPEDDVNPVGSFGPWAYTQALASNGEQPLDKIENIEFIADENDPKQKGNFWKVKDGGKTIIVPECYPRKLMKSVFEETTIDAGDNKVPLIDFIRGHQEIPWDEVSTTMWSDYSSKLKKASVISDHLQGRVPIKWGDVNSYTEWVNGINSALSKFGLRKSQSIQRWILYATLRVNPKTREPRLLKKTDIRTAQYAFSEKSTNFLPYEKVTFPWDKTLI